MPASRRLQIPIGVVTSPHRVLPRQPRPHRSTGGTTHNYHNVTVSLKFGRDEPFIPVKASRHSLWGQSPS